MENKLIDIIIPAYNAHTTIVKTLSSIVCQTIVDKCRVTIVNDAGKDYKEIVDIFSKYMDIQEIGYSINAGPGVARQFGIDNTDCPFIMFADADDTLYGALAVEIFLGTMERYPDCKVVTSKFVEQTYHEKDLIVQNHPNNMVWVFGKMYRRSFIDTNNIRFNKTRSNEDTGFNTLFELSLSGTIQEEMINLDEYLYCWHFNTNSITRLNGFEYTYNGNIPGFVENMIYAIKEAEKRNPFSDRINDKKIDVMTSLYFLYTEISQMSDKFKKENAKACVKYYNEIFKELDLIMDPKELKKKFIISCDKKISMILGIMPEMTFYQFYTAIKGATYEPESN